MRILGVDPGSGTTGYGIIDTDGSRHSAILYGAIKTNPRQPFHERLLKIYRDLSAIVMREKADLMAIEEVFHATNVQSALRLGHARGIALLVAAEKGIGVFEYSPLEIKSAVVGYGRAEKTQIQTMVRLLLNLPQVPTPDDAADALAVAICHAHRMTNYELRITK
ncbi:MAG TPA: crossover junction endodeoxyribonuclease RuvC [Acidobacteriota bacterium]|nr:crossover junction endodeoxyribonuclease RuvC [Acidobacteriota bacterium]